MSTWQPSFDGLEPAKPGGGPIETAARATLAALDERKLLTAENALDVQVILSLAATVDKGLAWPKPTVATSTFAKQLFEFIGRLPLPDQVSGNDEAWGQLLAAMAEA